MVHAAQAARRCPAQQQPRVGAAAAAGPCRRPWQRHAACDPGTRACCARCALQTAAWCSPPPPTARPARLRWRGASACACLPVSQAYSLAAGASGLQRLSTSCCVNMARRAARAHTHTRKNKSKKKKHPTTPTTPHPCRPHRRHHRPGHGPLGPLCGDRLLRRHGARVGPVVCPHRACAAHGGDPGAG